MASVYPAALAAFAKVIAFTAIEVNGDRGDAAAAPAGCRMSDCPLGRLLNAALLASCGDCAFALVNGGGLGGSYGADGNITIQTAKASAPFDNYVTTAWLTGARILAMLAVGVAASPTFHLCDSVADNPCCAAGEPCGAPCSDAACDDSGAYPQYLGLRCA